jgi:hypothetical protein
MFLTALMLYSGEVIPWTNANLLDSTLYLAQSLLFSPIYAIAYMPLLLMKSYQGHMTFEK